MKRTLSLVFLSTTGQSPASPNSAIERLKAVALVLACVLGCLAPCRLQAQNITTVAGTGIFGYNGDNIPAITAEINNPQGVAVDSAGNPYIADTYNDRIRKVDANGIITTVAGTGTSGYNGDNIPATSAELFDPYGLAVDSAGNLYIADTNNQRIRKVDASGTITTVAGNGTGGYNGDNIQATSAELYYPDAVAVDSVGNIYIVDQVNQRIRKVNASGIITTVAGNGTGGYNGDNIPATSAELFYPQGVVVDTAGNLYIGDDQNGRIRKVDTNGIITTVAGNGTFGYNGDNIPATSAELSAPEGVAVDRAGNLHITDTGNQRIRKVTNSSPYKANVQQPINSDNSSVFNASRGVVPVKFTLTLNGVATCNLPPATISLTRTAGGTIGTIDESVYQASADTGSSFRIDGCQYVYNLGAKSLGVGTYLVQISINGATAGTASFGLQ